MALDGIVVSNIIYELKNNIIGGRIDKIYQPERDELNITIRGDGGNHRLLLSANASNPRVHFLTGERKDNPMTAPQFCMVLRKHLAGGRIIGVSRPGFERIINIEAEAYNEMGDLSVKKLIIEIMGKHSNIILADDQGIILDSIKRISFDTSSVREVLPGKPYVLPPTQDKQDPSDLDMDIWREVLARLPGRRVQDTIYQSFTGISPVIASEICGRGGVWVDTYCEALDDTQIDALFKVFRALMDGVGEDEYSCVAYFDKKGKPVEFGAVEMSLFTGYEAKRFGSISDLLESYYADRDRAYRANQKTSDLKKLIQSNIERCVKKREIYERTEREVSGRDRHRIAGELLTANIYMLEKGMTSFTANNFHEPDWPEVTIALDADRTPSENAQHYFKKYNKEKRAAAALVEQKAVNDAELDYLEGLMNSANTCESEEDIDEIREELSEQGYIKRRKAQRGPKHKKTKPLRFVSADGFEILVGKNNKQNDELTLKTADAFDFWFHAKEIPGSHVILRADGGKASDAAMNEAANLAAFYSKAKNGSGVPVDYTYRKNVKKPSGAKPGMVIYDNYRTAYVTPVKPS